MKIAVMDYGSSNLYSMMNALRRINQSAEVIASPEELAPFDKVVLPGVGAAGSAMASLKASGFDQAIVQLKKPVLGICLGLQILAKSSEEDTTICLGVVPGTVKRYANTLKVPHMGWNRVAIRKSNPLWEGIPDHSHFYFVNSYYLEAPDADVVGSTEYGVTFASAIAHGNFWATQFHPEKSGPLGLRLLQNFCERC